MGGGLAGARCATRAGAVTKVRADPDYTARPSPRAGSVPVLTT